MNQNIKFKSPQSETDSIDSTLLNQLKCFFEESDSKSRIWGQKSLKKEFVKYILVPSKSNLKPTLEAIEENELHFKLSLIVFCQNLIRNETIKLWSSMFKGSSINAVTQICSIVTLFTKCLKTVGKKSKTLIPKVVPFANDL